LAFVTLIERKSSTISHNIVDILSGLGQAGSRGAIICQIKSSGLLDDWLSGISQILTLKVPPVAIVPSLEGFAGALVPICLYRRYLTSVFCSAAVASS